MTGGLFSDPSIVFDAHAPQRVISLVPSTTGSLVDLGLGDVLVGCSDYCELPESMAGRAARVGGPKTVDIEKTLSLVPDLVIANQEENAREQVEALAAAGLNIWLTFPQTVKDAVRDLWTTANLFRSAAAMRQIDLLERGVEWAGFAAEGQPTMRYFCPIWQGELASGMCWWMTFNHNTYSDDVLRIFNGTNIFADRERIYPIEADLGLAEPEPARERDSRYPRVRLEEIIAGQPDLILLPSEPFPYKDADMAKVLEVMADTPAVKAGRVYLLDGSLITWYGTRLARALNELPALFNVS